jgi:hypothetical protein
VDIGAIRSNHDPIDEQLDDAGLLGRKEVGPDTTE